MSQLTPSEIEALRSMPEFQDWMRELERIRKDEEFRAKRAEQRCPGADPIREKTGFRCPKCDLFLEYTDRPNENKSHEINLTGVHWNRPDRPDANPFTLNGRSGKAATFEDDDGSDWYMNH
jgi:hypothetical protein